MTVLLQKVLFLNNLILPIHLTIYMISLIPSSPIQTANTIRYYCHLYGCHSPFEDFISVISS